MHIKYILSHPIQYQSPLIRYLVKKRLNITVLYRSNISVKKFEKKFPIFQRLVIPRSFLRKNTIPVVRNYLKCNSTPLEPAKFQKMSKMRFLAVNCGMKINSKNFAARRAAFSENNTKFDLFKIYNEN